MYCPKCGQLVPDNMRFCSRCGLPLSEVSQWLVGAGGLAFREIEAQPNPPSPRRKGMRAGAKVMFWGGVMLPLFVAMSIAVDEPFPLFLPFIVILVGFSILLYSFLFGEKTSPSRMQYPPDPRFGPSPGQVALGPAGVEFIRDGKREVSTAEIVQPPSVTEQTTKLLDRE